MVVNGMSLAEVLLSSEQVECLHKYGSEFKDWIKTPEGKSDYKDHKEHETYIKETLSLENIEKLTEDKFREIFKTLWASRFFSNRDWLFDSRILPNGIDNIKKELVRLLYGTNVLEVRYDEFRSNIKGLGPSSLTEILHFIYPEKYPLWNKKPKTVLPFLGLDILPEKLIKYSFSKGAEYSQITRALMVVKNELTDFGINDFIDLDVFFWHLFKDIMPNEPERDTPIIKTSEFKIDSHEAAEYFLLELGMMMGYDTYTADQSKFYGEKRLGEISTLDKPYEFASEMTLNIVKNIDVMWFDREESPTHCFEVEHTTAIGTGLSRLIQISRGPVKLFIVAPEDKRRKYEQFLNRTQYRRRRDDFNFISYEELTELYETALPYHNLKNRILGE